MENLTADERRLVLPMMKNYIEKYTPAGDFEKSIWKRYEKPRGEARAESDGKLYYRINRKTGRIETNLLEWERSGYSG